MSFCKTFDGGDWGSGLRRRGDGPPGSPIIRVSKTGFDGFDPNLWLFLNYNPTLEFSVSTGFLRRCKPDYLSCVWVINK